MVQPNVRKKKASVRAATVLLLALILAYVAILVVLSLQQGFQVSSVELSIDLPLLDQTASSSQASQSSSSTSINEDPKLFMASITARDIPRPPTAPLATPNFYNLLKDKDCVPADKKCFMCLFNNNCEKCLKQCPCYCKAVCDTTHSSVPKHVASEWTVKLTSPATRQRDTTSAARRLIPRVVHQTYWDDVTDRAKYPNTSRLVQSFKGSGWDYRFYNDSAAVLFLQEHFPPQVLQAYHALVPGAFKADLFRYCVLLIHGGLYADVDVLLESTLDLSVAPDVGFMVPFDHPGRPEEHGYCVWNGIIAAAPGHPFLAMAIQTIVNQVRNRFTVVDMDETFCPVISGQHVLHHYDTLQTTGPCLLGASINRVAGRHAQTQFQAGTLESSDASIPGRTVILSQNKQDMGAMRFMLVDTNTIFAATDLSESNDGKEVKGGAKHYSKAHTRDSIYGLEHVYTDQVKANEDIRIIYEA